MDLQVSSEWNYVIEEKIGQGAFSTVYSGHHKDRPKERIAIKKITKANCVENQNKRLQNEISILRSISHPHVVPLIDLVDDGESLYMIMEIIQGGELFDSIVQKGQYTEKDAKELMFNLLSALTYLHSKDIAHRDLKPENLLLKKGSITNVMVTDFGLGRILNEESFATTACGTPYYVAPEVIASMPYTLAVDCWSCGVIAYFVMCGFPPFLGETLSEIFSLISKGEFDFPSPYWDNVSSQAKDFICSLLVVNPAERLTAKDSLKHPWFSSLKK